MEVWVRLSQGWLSCMPRTRCTALRASHALWLHQPHALPAPPLYDASLAIVTSWSGLISADHPSRWGGPPITASASPGLGLPRWHEAHHHLQPIRYAQEWVVLRRASFYGPRSRPL